MPDLPRLPQRRRGNTYYSGAVTPDEPNAPGAGLSDERLADLIRATVELESRTADEVFDLDKLLRASGIDRGHVSAERAP